MTNKPTSRPSLFPTTSSTSYPTIVPTSRPSVVWLSPPQSISCVLANDGSFFTVMFNAKTNRGNYGSSHQCSKLLNFTNNVNSLCVWVDHQTLKVYPSGNGLQSMDSLIQIGDVVSVKEGTLRAKCPVHASSGECAAWLTASSINCLLAAPLLALKPIVSIVVPVMLSQCKAFTLDITGSTGSGGRDWTTILVSVSSISQSNASLLYEPDIESFFENDFVHSPPTPMPAGFLLENETYVVTVMLCNFLSKCASRSTTVSVVNSNAIPLVTIAGSGSIRQLVRSDPLLLQSSAYVGTCEGTDRYSGMQFKWEIFEDDGSGQGWQLNEAIMSISKTPSSFKLKAATLSVGSRYTMTMYVTDTLYGGQSHASVIVDVLPSDVVAVVKRGRDRAWRVGETLTLDGSSSYDVDTQHGLDLDYLWSCDQTLAAPVLGSSFCTQLLLSSEQGVTVSALILNQSFIDVSSILGATFSLSLTVIGSYNRRAVTTVLVTVTESTAPIITLLASPTNINFNQQIKILTSVEVSVAPAIGVWALDDHNIDLTSISLVPSLFATFPVAGIYSFNLAIRGQSLPMGSAFDFSLSVGQSSTTIRVVVVSPPRPGQFSVSPQLGFEFQDHFLFSTSKWTDDELPLSYAFGYISLGNAKSMMELQRRKEVSSLAHVMLPGGEESRNFSLTCTVAAYNNLNAKSQLNTFVIVKRAFLNDEDFEQFVQHQLMQESDNHNMDVIKSIVSVGISILNVANCSQAPRDCGGRGRQACSGTPHTCGPCLDGYIGESSGDANSFCFSSAATGDSDTGLEALLVNGTCMNTTQCNPMQICVQERCSYPTKTCPSDCSGKGDCLLERMTSRAAVDDCFINDFTCHARCHCADGYFGAGCSSTGSEMQAKQRTRLSLILSFNTTLQFEDFDMDALFARVALIQDLGSTPSELTDESCDVLQVMIRDVITVAEELEVVYSDIEGVITVLDNCAALMSGRTITNLFVDSWHSTLLSENQLLRADFMTYASRSIMVGESEKQFVNVMSRSTISVQSALTSSEVAVPQTPLEALFGQQKSSVSTDSIDDRNYSTLVRHMFLEENEATMYKNGSTFVTKPLKIKYSVISDKRLTAFVRHPFITIVIQYIVPQQHVTNVSGVKFVTRCTRENVTSVMNYTCPDGQVVSHKCKGEREQITSVCPAERYLPVCRVILYDSSSPTADICSLISFTNTNVTCRCSVALTEAGTQVSDRIGHRLLRSTSGIESSGVIEVVSMSEYSYDGFIKTNSEIDEMTVADVRHGLLVIGMFVVFWAFGLVALLDLWSGSWCRGVQKVKPIGQGTQDEETSFQTQRRSAVHVNLGREAASLDKKKEYLLR